MLLALLSRFLIYCIVFYFCGFLCLFICCIYVAYKVVLICVFAVFSKTAVQLQNHGYGANASCGTSFHFITFRTLLQF